MPDPPQLPGFYYDSEKKRYFPITKNPLANTSEQTNTYYDQGKSKGPPKDKDHDRKVKPSVAKIHEPNSSVVCSLLKKYTFSARPLWIQKVDMQTALFSECQRLSKPVRWDNLTVQKFEYNHALRQVVYAGPGYLASTEKNKTVCSDQDHRYGGETKICQVRFLKIRPTNEIIVMGEDESNNPHFQTSLDNDTLIDVPVDKQISRANNLTCGLEDLVCATSDKIFSYTYDLQRKSSLKVPTEVQALSLSGNLQNNTAYYGLRNGKVLSWDMRSSCAQNVVRARGPVTHLDNTGLGTWGLLVCSLQGFHLYDLRAAEQPLFEYPGYSNEYDTNHGFSVNSRLGLAAVANGRSREGALVHVYDVNSGSVLHKWSDENLFKEKSPSKKHDERLWRYAAELALADRALVVGVDDEASKMNIESTVSKLA